MPIKPITVNREHQELHRNFVERKNKTYKGLEFKEAVSLIETLKVRIQFKNQKRDAF